MRLRHMMAMGALMLGAVGCGEAVGPPEAKGRDLDFFAPSVRPRVTASASRAWYEPITRADSMALQKRGGGPLASLTEQVPLISRHFVSGEWNDLEYRVMYGMFGGGTGYSMIPHIRIVDGRGFSALDENGLGVSQDLPLYWWMRPTNEERRTVNFSCGGFADTQVHFEARMSFYGLTPTIFRSQATDGATTRQPPCPPPPTQGGYGPPPTGYTITICNYEAWVDAWGNVIAVFDYGCSTVGGPILAE